MLSALYRRLNERTNTDFLPVLNGQKRNVSQLRYNLLFKKLAILFILSIFTNINKICFLLLFIYKIPKFCVQRTHRSLWSNFGEFSPWNFNNTKSIPYIFNINTSNNRCAIPVILHQISLALYLWNLKLLLFLSVIDENP